MISFTAAATAVAGLLQFQQLAADLSVTPALMHANVVIANPGNPQTLLLIGSDHRVGTPWKTSNTDTMMLVRLDPNSKTINLLSVPRDLQVEIPQGGAQGPGRLNSAYSIGGPNLLVRIMSHQVFPGLHVNHIIDVNFGGFRSLVNAIGCVYVDVDHRYYNNTAYTGYSSIDIQPGYQKLCGADALAFVRFRHTDSDLVRNARQQDFLRWVKGQFSSSYLLSNRDRLLRIFGKHTQTDADLHTVDGLINLFNLVVFSDGHTVKQIPFPAVFQPCGGTVACYVTASHGSEAKVFREFMTPTRAAPASAPHPQSHPSHASGPPPPVALTPDLSDGHAQVSALGHVGMPVFFPAKLANGSSYCLSTTGNCPLEAPSPGSYPRAYRLVDRSGQRFPAYRMTLMLNPILGEYYGVQGTTWQNPPILNNPTATRTVNGKRLLLYSNGGRISLVAWRTRYGVYWISNTLTSTLGPRQMVAIAASLRRG